MTNIYAVRTNLNETTLDPESYTLIKNGEEVGEYYSREIAMDVARRAIKRDEKQR